MRGLILLLMFVSPLAAQRVEDEGGYAFTTPESMEPLATSFPVRDFEPDYAFSGRAVPGSAQQVLLGIGLMGYVTGTGAIPEFRSDPNSSLVREDWNGQWIYGTRTIIADLRVALWVEVPLAVGALKVCVVCPVSIEPEARDFLRTIIATIEGDPAPPASESESAAGAATGGGIISWLLLLALLGLVAVVGWLLIMRKAPEPESAAAPAPIELPPPPPPPPETPATATIQPPWAVTRDSPGPATGGDVPPWEYKPKPPVP